MAYAKSKSAYDARVRLFVEELADSHRVQFFETMEKEFLSEQEAKKFRFDMYGYMAALSHEKPLKGLSGETIERDRDTSERARQWTISLTQNETTGYWVISAKAKVDLNDLTSMINALEERKARRLAQCGPLPDYSRPLTRIPSIEEYKAQQTTHTTHTTHIPPSTLPLYTELAESKLNDTQRNYVMGVLSHLPTDILSSPTSEEFFNLVAQSLAMSPDELSKVIGMRSFFNIVWTQAKIRASALTPATRPADNFTEELYGTAED